MPGDVNPEKIQRQGDMPANGGLCYSKGSGYLAIAFAFQPAHAKHLLLLGWQLVHAFQDKEISFPVIQLFVGDEDVLCDRGKEFVAQAEHHRLLPQVIDHLIPGQDEQVIPEAGYAGQLCALAPYLQKDLLRCIFGCGITLPVSQYLG